MRVGGVPPLLPSAANAPAETLRSESLLLDELFSSDPAESAERPPAAAIAAGRHWTRRQKMMMVAVGGLAFMLLVGTALNLLTRGNTLATPIAGSPQSEPASAEPPSPLPETPRQPTPDIPEAGGFVSLFDGKTLNGWEGDTARYAVEDGKLVVDFGPKPFRGPGGDLFTAKEYQDFVLRLEYTLSAGANGGILLRAPLGGNNWRESLEVQLLDDSAPPYQKLPLWNHNGALFGVVAVQPGHLKPPGLWNTLEIQWKGRRITETLNGAVVLNTDLDDPTDKSAKGAAHPGLKREKGRIILLGYASQGRLEFRNIQIKELAPASTPE